MKNEKLAAENKKNGTKEVAVRMSVCPPTIADADAIMACYMDAHKDCGLAKLLSWEEKEEAYRAGEYSILRDFFGFSANHYENAAAAKSAFGRTRMTNDLPSEVGEVTGEVAGGLRLWFYIEESKADLLEDSYIDWNECKDRVKLSPRKASDVNPQVVKYIEMLAEEFGANWRDGAGYETWFDLISLDTAELIAITDELTEKVLAK